MSTSVYIGLNPFNLIRKHFPQICARKLALHLQKLLEVMSTSVDTGLNPLTKSMYRSLSAQLLFENTVYVVTSQETVTSFREVSKNTRNLIVRKLSL
jgi:hypothetical protein